MKDTSGHNFKEALLARKSGEQINCGLCFRECSISKDKSGFCKTRYNQNGRLNSIIYGIISKLSVDAVEEKPFKHFKSGTNCLSFGTFGCNLRCKGCQNVEVSWGAQELPNLLQGQINKSVFVPPDVIVQIAKDLMCDGIAFTYNEPAIWLEYVLDAAKIAKESGLYTVYVTNSALTKESLDSLAPYIDAIATDIKSTEDAFYADLCAANQAVGKVLESIKYAQEKGIHIETRTNIIPGFNDTDDIIYGIANWIKNNLGADSPWHITRFYPANELTNVEATPLTTLEKAYNIAKEVGLENAYAENKPCDCAVGETSEDIRNLLLKYQPNGVIVNEDVLNLKVESNKCSCSCCG